MLPVLLQVTPLHIGDMPIQVCACVCVRVHNIMLLQLQPCNVALYAVNACILHTHRMLLMSAALSLLFGLATYGMHIQAEGQG